VKSVKSVVKKKSWFHMNNKSNRREFLRHASVLSLAAASGLTAFSASGQEAIRRVGGPRLKVSLNAYSFNAALTAPASGGKPTVTLFDLLDFCARHNFDGIDPTGYYFPGYPQVPADSWLNDFKRRAFQLGIGISGTGVRNNFASPDKAQRAADVQLVKQWIEVAAKLGAPVIRVFAGAEIQGHSRDEVLEWMVADLKQCVEHGRKHGVLVGIQNHGDFLKTAEQVLQVVKRVNSDWFGVIVDTGNFQTGDPYEEIARVLPYAVNFQVKESPYGRESNVPTDLKRFVQIVRAGGYRGYLPIETLVAPGKEYDPNVTVPRFLNEVRQAIGQED
jgi:sugar phosphate isomerase/epimerase